MTDFGVTVTEVRYAYPDVEVHCNANVTEAGLAYLIQLAGDELAGVLNSVGVDVSSISSGSTLYRNCQRMTLDLLGPRLQAAAHGQVATAAELVDIREAVTAQVRELRLKVHEMGDVGDSAEPRTVTSTSLLGLNTDDVSRRSRRFFDSSRLRSSGGADDIYRN